MKKTGFAMALLIALAACGGGSDNTLTLKGEIKGLGTDTLYLYGMDMMYNRTDTLPVEEDRFELELELDTIVSAWLEFSDGGRYPLFLDKGKRLTLKGTAGDVESISVTGSTPNDELTAFHKELQELEAPTEHLYQAKADTFIQRHPASVVSAYLLDKYFVQTSEPDMKQIKSLIAGMAGSLRDRPHIKRLLELANDMERVDMNRQAPFLQVPNAEGKRISRNDFNEQYLLVHFWASWNAESLRFNNQLRDIYQKELKPGTKKGKKQEQQPIAFWGISLDLEREAWRSTVERDTLAWEQGCDLLGWNSQPVKQFFIDELPANVLLNPSGRIIGKDLSIDAIADKVKELKKEAAEKEKTKKKKKN